MEIVFFWIGVLLVWIGAAIVRFSRREFAGARQVDGQVIGYVRHTENGGQTFAPVVSFVHPLAGQRILRSGLSAGNLPYSVGARLPVLIDLQDAAMARVQTNGFLYFGLVFIAIGLGCCVLFFAIFSWDWFSIVVAILVTAALIMQGRQQREALPKLAGLRRVMRQALGGSVVEAAAFDHSQLLSAAELSRAQRRTSRQSLIAGGLLLLIGAGGLVGSWFWTERRGAFLQQAASAEGRVVELAVSSDSDSMTYAPVVEFTPRNATAAVRFRHPVSSSHPSYRVGQEVRVLHDPINPSEALIDQGWWTTALPMMPGALGLILALLGVLSLNAARRHRVRAM